MAHKQKSGKKRRGSVRANLNLPAKAGKRKPGATTHTYTPPPREFPAAWTMAEQAKVHNTVRLVMTGKQPELQSMFLAAVRD